MNYFRKKRLQQLYRERYSFEEIYLMYRDWLFTEDSRAVKQLRKILRKVWRYQRV